MYKPAVLCFNYSNMKNNTTKRMMGAELALLATMVEVATLAVFAPEYRQILIVLSVPFMIYGLYFVITQKQCR